MAPKGKRSGSRLDLGGQQAEADPLAETAFYSNRSYERIESRDDRHCFLIGRTGSGKSAILQQLESRHSAHVIRVAPEDLSLPYVANLGVMKHLHDLEVGLDPFFIALWKHVLLVEIIRHRYNVDSPAAKSSFLNELKDKVRRDSSKQAALEYLDEFGERFWCETDERVKEITDRFEKNVTKVRGIGLSLGRRGEVRSSKGSTSASSTEEVRELNERLQKVVQDTQLPRLNKMIRVLNEDILESDANFTYVVIDDLDRDWVDGELTNDLVRCLFRAVIDLQRVRNLKVVVALRTNIFDHLNFGSKSGGQEEKYRGLAIQLRWTDVELEGMLDQRTRAAAHRSGATNISGFKSIIPNPGRRGNALTFVLDRTLRRPRDCIALVNGALEFSKTGKHISWDDLASAEQSYSHQRLLALRDEWKPSFPGIDMVFEEFRRCGQVLDETEIIKILDGIVLLPAEQDFIGDSWLTPMTKRVLASKEIEFAVAYQPIIRLLFRMGFLGIWTDNGSAAVYSYEDIELVERNSVLASARFVVHPAFQPTLDISP